MGESVFPPGLPVFTAPAKLNLFLHITGRRADGYHELQTLFQLLDFGDRLAFEVTADSGIHRVTGLPGVEVSEDLVVRAAHLLQAACHCREGCRIYIDKRLPLGGGLGGGSSDAATALRVLNHQWQCGLGVDELAELGRQLGADVPVFVRGYSAWGEGIGEELEPVELASRYFAVLRPEVAVSTARLFSSSQLTRDLQRITIRDFLATGGENVFEPVARSLYPEIDKAMNWLDNFARSRLTGTGSCVFAEFETRNTAQAVIDALPAGLVGFVAKGVNRSPLLSEMGKSL